MFCVILSICRYELVFFPDCLKLARVTLIPKSGNSTNAGNYRPILVLLIFSKIFEKVVQYSNPLINTVNGSCMFAVLIESMLIEVKNKRD